MFPLTSILSLKGERENSDVVSRRTRKGGNAADVPLWPACQKMRRCSLLLCITVAAISSIDMVVMFR